MNYVYNGKTMNVKDFIEMFINNSLENDVWDVWINDDNEYPCLALLINDENTAIHYFKDDNDCGSISCNEEIQSSDEYAVFGDIWLGKKYVVDRSKVVDCIMQFIADSDRPLCIDWFEL